jgi:hypothetical protein
MDTIVSKPIFVIPQKRIINKEDYPMVLDWSDYKNVNTKLPCKCQKCKETTYISIREIDRTKRCFCYKCRNITTEEFIQKAKLIHGDKYDYSKVNYEHSKKYVIIICKKHGEFLQKPNCHLSGDGCCKCGGNCKSNTSEFIKKAKLIHGDKYDYSKVNYVNQSTKVCIICLEHGDFLQSPKNHLKGNGCYQCARKYLMGKRISNDEYIKRCKEKHGDKYDYSKVVYNSTHNTIKIICPIHGEFNKEAVSFIKQKCPCPKCGRSYKSNTSEFIEKARIVHGDRYNYSKVEYVNSKDKVCILCKIHGEYFITPNDHLGGHGCSKCSISKLESILIRKFDEDDIKYFYNFKKFKWLKKISLLELDFYLPDYNIAIECQGLQHYKPQGYHGGYEKYLYLVENDKIKHDLCKQNGIKLLYYVENLSDVYFNKEDSIYNRENTFDDTDKLLSAIFESK